MYGHIKTLAEAEKKGIEAAGGSVDLFQSSRPTTPSCSVSPQGTATSPPSGRLSGTGPAANGPLAPSGASTPVCSSAPAPLVAVRKALPLPPCRLSPTMASSTSLSATSTPSPCCLTYPRSAVAPLGVPVPSPPATVRASPRPRNLSSLRLRARPFTSPSPRSTLHD
ncbi:hypothetical protein MPH_00622 [Macrophomina phaseolina MS6]|uniref:Uncharacterized protein n=1 Tax=Macrophomina phaseolina (strain MS6) TaxID=1126212 RepID=K2RHI2_MACPH|nr:hypothetical protein MPH_00622 [Macrophomina phaseolina MS6]